MFAGHNFYVSANLFHTIKKLRELIVDGDSTVNRTYFPKPLDINLV